MKFKYAKLLLLGVLVIGLPVSINSPATAEGGFSQQQQQDSEYSCPMHPEVTSKKAGSCPKCGMRLKQKSTTPEPAATSNINTGPSRFPNVELITQDGKKVRFYDDLIKGRVVAIYLMYTTCKYNCPLETARLVQVQKMLGDRMGRDVFFYSITIEPETDTPEVLKAYIDKYKIGPGWTFLTGKEDDIRLLMRKLGLDFLPDPDDPDGHTPSLLIGNDRTGIWARNSALDNPRFMALKIQQMIGYESKVIDTVAAKAEGTRLNIDKGQYLFATRCAACHTIGNGDRVGPDLIGVTNVRDIDWLRRTIIEPDKLLAEQDPIAMALFKKYKEVRMPKLGLPPADVETIIDYMKRRTESFRAEEKSGAQK